MEYRPRTRTGSDYVKMVVTSAWLWGGAATWAYYAALPYSPVAKDFLVRYTCSHPLEYIETAMFFVAMAIIITKALSLMGERRAFKKVARFGPSPAIAAFPAAVTHLQKEVETHCDALRDTYWGRRLDNILTFISGRSSSAGLSEHLGYLTEAEDDLLHRSHSLLQTLIWAIPILGFLGTVMGITLAIANVTPEQLESSLNDVTGGLAVAFDTTAIALTFSLVMVFGSLFVKRGEEGLLFSIDERCRIESHRCFGETSAAGHPLLEAEDQAAQLLLRQTAQMIDRQTGLWNNAIGTLAEQWSQTLASQQTSLAQSLQQGTQQTLLQHTQQLAESREHSLAAQEQIGIRMMSELDRLLDKRQQADASLAATLGEVAEQMTAAAQEQARVQASEVERLLAGMATQMASFENRTQSWQAQLAELVDTLGQQADALAQHGSHLERIAGQEDSLLRLQDHLNRNLESIRTAETFDQTLLSLNAAVNLLTSRVRGREAA